MARIETCDVDPPARALILALPAAPVVRSIALPRSDSNSQAHEGFPMRTLLAAGLCGLAGLIAIPANAEIEKGKAKRPAAPTAGIKTPGVQIPIESLQPEGRVAVETPGWIT